MVHFLFFPESLRVYGVQRFFAGRRGWDRAAKRTFFVCAIRNARSDSRIAARFGPQNCHSQQRCVDRARFPDRQRGHRNSLRAIWRDREQRNRALSAPLTPPATPGARAQDRFSTRPFPAGGAAAGPPPAIDHFNPALFGGSRHSPKKDGPGSAVRPKQRASHAGTPSSRNVFRSVFHRLPNRTWKAHDKCLPVAAPEFCSCSFWFFFSCVRNSALKILCSYKTERRAAAAGKTTLERKPPFYGLF